MHPTAKPAIAAVAVTICFHVSTASASAQAGESEAAFEAVIAACADKLISYLDWPAVKNSSWHFIYEAPSGGALHYFGASHSDDPSHPQFDQIEAAYAEMQPTVVFYEGPSRPIGDNRDETIKKFGESGYLRYLATESKADIRRLEPSPIEEMKDILKTFTPEQAGLFFVLREASRLRERKGMDEQQLTEAVTGLLGQARQIMPAFPFATTDDLQRSYEKHWSEPPMWWQAPANWFTPSAENTDGGFTHAVNRASSEFRNRHMYEELSRAVLSGERVFAVVGRNHVPMQVPALECALE